MHGLSHIWSMNSTYYRGIVESGADKNDEPADDDDYPITKIVPLDLRMCKKYCKKEGFFSFKFHKLTYYYYISGKSICVILPTEAKEKIMWKYWREFISGVLPQANENYYRQSLPQSCKELFSLEFSHARSILSHSSGWNRTVRL